MILTIDIVFQVILWWCLEKYFRTDMAVIWKLAQMVVRRNCWESMWDHRIVLWKMEMTCMYLKICEKKKCFEFFWNICRVCWVVCSVKQAINHPGTNCAHGCLTSGKSRPLYQSGYKSWLPPQGCIIGINTYKRLYIDTLFVFNVAHVTNEPLSEKSFLWGFRPGQTQTGLYSNRRC